MRARITLLLMTLAALPAALDAQSTDTEKEAAAAILRQIDSLEGRLQPARTAARLLAFGGQPVAGGFCSCLEDGHLISLFLFSNRFR